MNTHCSDYECLVFHGQILGAEESVSVCLEPGLHYGFRYGVPGKPLIASFSIDATTVRGDFDWQRFGETDWASLTLPVDGVTYTLWVSRPDSDDALPQGRMDIKGGDMDAELVLEPSSIVSTLPFD